MLLSKYSGFGTNDFLISGAVSWTARGDLSFGSSRKEVLYFFVSQVASASETALLTSTEILLGERVIWPEAEAEGLLDILMGKGRKVLVEDVGEKGGEFISVVKFDMTGAMFKY